MKKTEKKSDLRTVGIMAVTGALAGSVLGVRSAITRKRTEALKVAATQATVDTADTKKAKKQAKKSQKKMEKRILKQISGMMDKKISRKLASIPVQTLQVQMGREKEVIKQAKKSLKAQKALKKTEKAALKRAKDIIKAQDA